MFEKMKMQPANKADENFAKLAEMFPNAVTETIVSMAPDAALSSREFRVGGFHAVNQARLLPAGILILLAILLVCTLTNELEVLGLGDDTAHSLGLRKIGDSTVQPDNDQTRGKIAKIGYLLQVTEAE